MISVYNQILNKIKQSVSGNVYTTKDFLNIANRISIDKALSALVKDGILRRLTRGIYDYPVNDPRLGILPPDLNKLIDAIQRQSGHTIQIDGAKAANVLGLSTQVPAQIIYLTDGHSRNIKIGNWIIKIKHASPKTLVGAGQIAGYVLQALRYLGKSNINSEVINKINVALTSKDKKQLKKLMPYAPGWAYNTLQKITTEIG